MAGTIPSKVLNKYNNSGTDNLIGVYSDGKVDVYTDQRVIDWFIQYPAPYSGEFSGPLYFAFRDKATRQSIIRKIRNNRPANFQPNMTCTVLDPANGTPIKRNQDCANGGPSRNLDFLKYIAADVTFTTHGPGNVLLPPGTSMPMRLFIIGSVLYLSSPRCVGPDAFNKAASGSVPQNEDYIDALGEAGMNSTLIGETYGGSDHDEFIALFADGSSKIATTILPGDYQVGESDGSLLSLSVKGAALRITEGRRK
jgi:hypothetical protein